MTDPITTAHLAQIVDPAGGTIMVVDTIATGVARLLLRNVAVRQACDPRCFIAGRTGLPDTGNCFPGKGGARPPHNPPFEA